MLILSHLLPYDQSDTKCYINVSRTQIQDVWFSTQPDISNNSLENQNTRLENQMAKSVKCIEKFVFGFQEELCSLGHLENQIDNFGRRHF